RSGAATCSYGFLVGESLFEKGLGLVLVGLFGDREFTDENLPRLGPHAFLAGGQTALLVSAPKITHILGDLVDIAGCQFLQVGLVAPGPVGGLFGVRRTQHLEDLLQAFLSHYVSNADLFRVLGRYMYRKIALVDPQNEVGSVLTFNSTSLDRFQIGRAHVCTPVSLRALALPDALPILAPGPAGGPCGVRRTPHLEDLLQAFLSHSVSNADLFRVLGRYMYRKIALVDPQNEVGSVLTFNSTSLDRF